MRRTGTALSGFPSKQRTMRAHAGLAASRPSGARRTAAPLADGAAPPEGTFGEEAAPAGSSVGSSRTNSATMVSPSEAHGFFLDLWRLLP